MTIKRLSLWTLAGLLLALAFMFSPAALAAVEEGAKMIGQPHINAKTGGHFVFEQDGVGKSVLVCKGNLRDRVIESIALDGQVIRPPGGQTWSI